MECSMKQLLAKYKLNRSISILVAFITIGLAYLYYGRTYSLTADPDILAKKISEYIIRVDVQAEVELIHEEDDWLYVVFSDDRYGDSFKGLARLQRGWNGKYVIRSASYSQGYPISAYLFADGTEDFALYGLFPDDRAVRYEYVNKEDDVIRHPKYSGEIKQRAFVQICKDGIPDFSTIHVYDNKGQDISTSYSATTYSNIPEGTTASAQRYMIDVYTVIIMVVGFTIAIRLWFKKQKVEKKVAKQEA